jgi:hypothetical protein
MNAVKKPTCQRCRSDAVLSYGARWLCLMCGWNEQRKLIDMTEPELRGLMTALAGVRAFFGILDNVRAYDGSDDRFIKKLRLHYRTTYIDVVKALDNCTDQEAFEKVCPIVEE